jgi:hypothetical protein
VATTCIHHYVAVRVWPNGTMANDDPSKDDLAERNAAT